jgi:hypothetical protein
MHSADDSAQRAGTRTIEAQRSSDGATHARDVLTAAEIRGAPLPDDATAFDAIHRLRPEFLSQRALSVGGERLIPPALRINDALATDSGVLATIPARTVIEVRFVRPFDAVYRFGQMFTAGLLIVRTAP